MRKRITKDGNSHKIRITMEEMELHGLKADDIVELTITKIDSKPRRPKKYD